MKQSLRPGLWLIEVRVLDVSYALKRIGRSALVRGQNCLHTVDEAAGRVQLFAQFLSQAPRVC